MNGGLSEILPALRGLCGILHHWDLSKHHL
jgi:hypothetical protein